MKVSRVKYNIVTLLMFIIFAGVLIFTNVTVSSVPVVTVPGSYAERFAIDNSLKVGTLPDSASGYFDQRYEIFDYNKNEDGITVERYQGQSTELVIPAMIDGQLVTGVGDDFFSTLKNVSKVYIPITVSKLPKEPVKDIMIECDRDAYFAQDENSGWNIQTQYDSDYVNLFMGDCKFLYNETAGGIDIAGYIGDDKNIIIPSYINGVPVTIISMDLEGDYDLVVIPATVVSITGRVFEQHMGIGFVLTLLASAVAFILVILYTNIVIRKFKDPESYARVLPGVVTAYLYLMIQLILGIFTTYLGIPSPVIFFFISIVLIAGFILFESLLSGGRKHSERVEENTVIKTSWMKNFKLSCADLADNIKDADAKKSVERLVEEIKYSSAASAPELIEDEAKLEEAVEELRQAIITGNKDEIISMADNAMHILDVRNRKSRLIR